MEVELKIYRTRFDEDGIVEGEYGPDSEVIEEEELVEVEDVDTTLAQMVARKLYDLGATECSGSWWSDPDGSQIIDYSRARREAITVHLPDDAPAGLYDSVCDIIEEQQKAQRIKSNHAYYGKQWNSNYGAKFYDTVGKLSTVLRADVEAKQQMAMAYVWGWQDRNGETDTDVALAFGYAYGLHAAEFALEQSFVRMNIKDAWKQWSSSGKVKYEGV